MIYRCQMLETAEKTEAAAHAAHLYFAPALIENARMQGKAMASSMSPTRRSSEIIPELEQIEASFYARRKELQREIQGQFGCGYKGSI